MEVSEMNVKELTNEIIDVIETVTINLWKTNRERSNTIIDMCVNKMINIKLKANKKVLSDVVENLSVAYGAFESITDIFFASNIKAENILKGMLDNASFLTDVSDLSDNSCPTCDSDSDS